MTAVRLIFVTFLIVALAPIEAVGCTVTHQLPTVDENFEMASSVFVAHVFRTEEVKVPTDQLPRVGPLVEGTFRVTEVLKGQPPIENKVQTAFPDQGNCSLFLLAGFDYVFFLGNNTVVDAASGSRPLIPSKAETRQLLEKLRWLKSGNRSPDGAQLNPLPPKGGS